MQLRNKFHSLWSLIRHHRIICFLFFFPFVLLSYPYFKNGFIVTADGPGFFLPYHFQLLKSFHSPGLFFINPYNYMGNLFCNEVQFPLNPLYFIYSILPFFLAFNVTYVLYFSISSVGMFLFLKRMGFVESSCFFGAIIYGYSGFSWAKLLVGHEMVLAQYALFPFVLICLLNFFSTSSNKWIYISGILIALQLWMSYPQTTIIMGLCYTGVSFFKIFQLRHNKDLVFRKLIGLAFILFVVMGMGAVRWLSALIGVLESWRGAGVSKAFFLSLSLPPIGLFDLFINSFWGHNAQYINKTASLYQVNFGEMSLYCGFFSLVLCLWAIINEPRKSGYFLIPLLLIVWISMGKYGWGQIYLYFYYVKIFNFFRGSSKFLVLIPFFVSIGATIGHSHFMGSFSAPARIKLFKLRNSLLILFSVIVFLALLIHGKFPYKFLNPQLSVPPSWVGLFDQSSLKIGVLLIVSILFLEWRLKFKENVSFVFLVLLQIFIMADLVSAGYPLIHNIDRQESIVYKEGNPFITYLKSQSPFFRIVVTEYETLTKFFPGNIGMLHQIENVGGVSIVPGRFLEMVRTINLSENSYPGFKNEVTDPVYTQGPGSLRDAYRLLSSNDLSMIDPLIWNYGSNILDLFNVKYVLSRDKIISQKLVPVLVFQGATLYENKSVFPRYFDLYEIKAFENRESLLKFMESKEFDGSKSLLIEKKVYNQLDPIKASNSKSSPAAIHLDIKEPDYSRLTVDFSKGGFLVCAERFSLGWRCLLDGRPVPVLPAFNILMAVEVPPGKHVVEFRFDRTLFYIALFLTLVTIYICFRGGTSKK